MKWTAIALAATLVPCMTQNSNAQMAPATNDWKVSEADVDKDGRPDLVVEGGLVRAAIAAQGGGIASFFDKIRNHEEVKMFSSPVTFDGANQLRISGIVNDADTTVFQITHHAGDNGSLVVEATGDVTLTIDEEKVGPIRLTYKYIFEPGVSRLHVMTRFENKSDRLVNFAPWIKHLLKREGVEESRIAFMTPYGVYESEKPIPGRGGQIYKPSNLHYETSSNWVSRTTMPLINTSNTLATVASPQRLFKVYTWKKPSEDYTTQEFILSPRQLKPGEADEYEYFLTLSAPLITPAYSSPLFNMEVLPHPMGLPSSTKELTFRIAATRALGSIDATGELKRLDAVEAPQKIRLSFTGVNPQSIATATAPVSFAPKGRYMLELNLQSGGNILLPGAEIGDNEPVRIPLVTDDVLSEVVTYPSRLNRDKVFPRLQPKQISAPLIANAGGISAYRIPATQRVFEADTLQPSTKGVQPVFLETGANEYQSFQVVLASANKTPSTFSVAATPLQGKGEATVTVDRLSRFLYAETKVPSGYSPMYGLGRYPEGLKETSEIQVQPGVTAPLFVTYHVAPGTPPGEYRGQITLKSGDSNLTVPVTMRVLNYELPARPALDVIGDPKSGGASVLPIYMRYRVTPSYMPMIVPALLGGNFAEVEKQMPPLIAQGLTRIYLGYTVELLKVYGPERIKAIDEFLKAHGWVDYFYVRPGFDEASSDKVDELKAVSQAWKAVSSIKVMETYYYDEGVDKVFGSLDIYSRGLSRAPWIQERMKAGDKFWRVNAFPGSLENEPRDTWKLYLSMADYGYTGTYIWTLSAWRETEWGKDWWADDGVANMSATLVWKDETKLLPTIRLEALRDAIEGYTLYDMLKKRVANPRPGDTPQQLQRAKDLLGAPPLSQRIKTDADVERIHNEMGEALSDLNS